MIQWMCMVQGRAQMLCKRRQQRSDSWQRSRAVRLLVLAATAQKLRDGIHSNLHLLSAFPMPVSVPGWKRDTVPLQRSQASVEHSQNPKYINKRMNTVIAVKAINECHGRQKGSILDREVWESQRTWHLSWDLEWKKMGMWVREKSPRGEDTEMGKELSRFGELKENIVAEA